MDLPRPPPAPYSAISNTTTSPAELYHNRLSYTNEKDQYTYNASQLQNSRHERGSKSTTGRGHDSVISHPFSPKASSPPSPASSISSAGRKSRSIPEVRYSSPPRGSRDITYPPQARIIDPEKAAYSSPSPGRRSPNVAQDAVYDQAEYHEKGPEEKAWQLLFFLSGPCALLSMGIMLYTFFALLITVFLLPLKLVSKRAPLSQQIISFLAPPLNLQLHLVYSYNSATDYSAPMLVVIHLFSPVVALGVAISAWTAAAFWIFTSILGDPGGNDGHNDGKESILGVRNWWDRWLSRALRDTA